MISPVTNCRRAISARGVVMGVVALAIAALPEDSVWSASEQASQQPATTTVAENDADKAAIKRGRAKAQGCTRCHGRDGIQRLAEATDWTGPVGLFVVKQLTELRDGVRHHVIMTDIARPLTDEDISEISAWVQSMADKSQ